MVEDPSELTAERASAMLELRGGGVAYVEQQHGRESWLDGYERIFGECLR